MAGKAEKEEESEEEKKRKKHTHKPTRSQNTPLQPPIILQSLPNLTMVLTTLHHRTARTQHKPLNPILGSAKLDKRIQYRSRTSKVTANEIDCCDGRVCGCCVGEGVVPGRGVVPVKVDGWVGRGGGDGYWGGATGG
jgi:hypothetical protein